MKDKVTMVMIDTNLWVYLYAKKPSDKYLKVRELVGDRFEAILVSTQIVGELYHVSSAQEVQNPSRSQANRLRHSGKFSSSGN